jgi:hypothetical protein
MGPTTLYGFIGAYRDEIIRRCTAKVATRSMPPPTEGEMNHGIPLFLDQLGEALLSRRSSNADIGRSAGLHGHDLLLQGFTVGQSSTIMATSVSPSPSSRQK